MTIRKYRAALAAVLAIALVATTVPVLSFTIPYPSISSRTIAFAPHNHPAKVSSPGVRNHEPSSAIIPLYAAAEVSAPPPAEAGEEKLFEPLGKGVWRDYQMRLPHLVSDVTDGFNVQVSP
jgi:hypothetical protein